MSAIARPHHEDRHSRLVIGQRPAHNIGTPFNDKGTIMARTLASSLEKHPLKFAVGLVINLGGMLAIAANL